MHCRGIQRLGGAFTRLRIQYAPHQVPPITATVASTNKIAPSTPSSPDQPGYWLARLTTSPHNVKGIVQPRQAKEITAIGKVTIAITRSGPLLRGAGGEAEENCFPHFQQATALSGRVVWQLSQTTLPLLSVMPVLENKNARGRKEASEAFITPLSSRVVYHSPRRPSSRAGARSGLLQSRIFILGQQGVYARSI